MRWSRDGVVTEAPSVSGRSLAKERPCRQATNAAGVGPSASASASALLPSARAFVRRTPYPGQLSARCFPGLALDLALDLALEPCLAFWPCSGKRNILPPEIGLIASGGNR
jgi:hypothetical protein